MIVSFRNAQSQAIYDGEKTRAARRCLPVELWRTAQRKLSQMNAVELLTDLAVPPKNSLEALKKDRKGQHSIRINDRYRICFIRTPAGPSEVEVTDYH